MRKLFTAIIMSVFAFWTLAQTKFYVFMKDGSEVEYNISEVDSIGFSKRTPVVDPITPENKEKTSIVVETGKRYKVKNSCDGSSFEFTVVSTSGSIAKNDQEVVISDGNRSYTLTDNLPYLNNYDFGLRVVNIGDAIPGNYLVFALGWANATENYTLESPTLNNLMTEGCEHVFEEVDINNSVVIDNHEYVDLGLPSGNLWATCNIGAKTPSEWGEFFAWGDTATKSEYAATNCATFGRTIEQLNYLGYTNKVGNLTVGYDAAYQNWGGNWRMPTRVDFQELINECKWTWTTVGNVYGYEVKSKAPGNNNSIFLPAAGSKDEYDIRNRGVTGWYWTSTGFSIDYMSWNLMFDKEEGCQMTPLSRRLGESIRPIYVKP